jgi:hypothetical protein
VLIRLVTMRARSPRRERTTAAEVRAAAPQSPRAPLEWALATPALRLLVVRLLVVRLLVVRLLLVRLLVVRPQAVRLLAARPQAVQAQAAVEAQSTRATARIGRPVLQSPA